MKKKETINPKEILKQNYEAKKMNTSDKFKKHKKEGLPWWVEILFVQIGLPEKLLIKILNLIFLLVIFRAILSEQIISLPTMADLLFYVS